MFSKSYKRLSMKYFLKLFFHLFVSFCVVVSLLQNSFAAREEIKSLGNERTFICDFQKEIYDIANKENNNSKISPAWTKFINDPKYQAAILAGLTSLAGGGLLAGGHKLSQNSKVLIEILNQPLLAEKIQVISGEIDNKYYDSYKNIWNIWDKEGNFEIVPDGLKNDAVLKLRANPDGLSRLKSYFSEILGKNNNEISSSSLSSSQARKLLAYLEASPDATIGDIANEVGGIASKNSWDLYGKRELTNMLNKRAKIDPKTTVEIVNMYEESIKANIKRKFLPDQIAAPKTENLTQTKYVPNIKKQMALAKSLQIAGYVTLAASIGFSIWTGLRDQENKEKDQFMRSLLKKYIETETPKDYLNFATNLFESTDPKYQPIETKPDAYCKWVERQEDAKVKSLYESFYSLKNQLLTLKAESPGSTSNINTKIN